MEKTLYTIINPKNAQGMFFTGYTYTSSIADAIFYESEENAKEELNIIIPEKDRSSCQIVPVNISAEIPDSTIERLKGLTEDEVLPILFDLSDSFYNMYKELTPYDFDNMGSENSGEDIYTFFFNTDNKNFDLIVMVNPQRNQVQSNLFNYSTNYSSPLLEGDISEDTFKKIYERVKGV